MPGASNNKEEKVDRGRLYFLSPMRANHFRLAFLPVRCFISGRQAHKGEGTRSGLFSLSTLVLSAAEILAIGFFKCNEVIRV